MTWTIKDQYCLLFLWAEHDLDNYWINNERPVHDGKPDVEAIRWTMKQIVGMAGALDTMHNPRNVNLAPKKKYARHGDIKPENILWYNSPNDSRGIFVIADLGLTTLNSTKSRSMQPGRFVPVTAGYRPPECDLKGGVVSRAFDVWTYGCLLLELVCWILGGQAHRKRFETYRKTVYITNTKSEIFFDIIESSDGKTGYAVSVKKEVTKVLPLPVFALHDQLLTPVQWIADLHNHEYCTQFVHELLDLIEDQMITVVSAVRERIKTDDLHQRLKDMYRQVTDDSSPYCQIPFPEPRRPKVIRAVDATLHDDALALIKEKEPKLGVHDSSQYGKTQASKTPKQLADLGN
jgi:serine/threonine protein kinase